MRGSRQLASVRERWALVFIVPVVAAAAAYGLAARTTPTYSATTTVFLSTSRTSSVSELNQGATFIQSLTASYATVAKSPVVLAPVITGLGLATTPGQLAGTLHVVVDPSTVLLDITATDPSASRAAAVANAVGAQLGKTVTQLSVPGVGAQAEVVVTTVRPAVAPTSPSSPRTRRMLALALLGGLALGLALAALLEALRPRLRTAADVRALVELPVLASVPFLRGRQVLSDRAQGPGAESYRSLRTNLLSSRPLGGGQALVVTSPTSGDGRSTTVTNLAIALAVSGARVLLVDADLRSPGLAQAVRAPGRPGLVEVLRRELAVEQVVQRRHGLDLLVAGGPADDPSELLGSRAMVDLLAEACKAYDHVVLDSPPVLDFTDAAVLGRLCHRVLVVVDASRARVSDLEGALSALEVAAVELEGLVLLKARGSLRPTAGSSAVPYAQGRHALPAHLAAPLQDGREVVPRRRRAADHAAGRRADDGPGPAAVVPAPPPAGVNGGRADDGPRADGRAMVAGPPR